MSTTRVIYCVYKHPLSILIHLKYQDKDGCLKNGSKELLLKIKMLDRNMFNQIDSVKYLVYMKRLPLDLADFEISNCSFFVEKQILNCSILKCEFHSSVPIDQEEKSLVKKLQKLCCLGSGKDGKLIERWAEDPRYDVMSDIASAGGHVIGMSQIEFYHDFGRYDPYKYTKIISTLSQFPNLRSLKCKITNFGRDNLDFQETFGVELGSKIVHLNIEIGGCIQLDQLQNSLPHFTRLKSLILKSHNSLQFDASLFFLFNLNNYCDVFISLIGCFSSLTNLLKLDLEKFTGLCFSFIIFLIYNSSLNYLLGMAKIHGWILNLTNLIYLSVRPSYRRRKTTFKGNVINELQQIEQWPI